MVHSVGWSFLGEFEPVRCIHQNLIIEVEHRVKYRWKNPTERGELVENVWGLNGYAEFFCGQPWAI
jgi:hypothetical protein